MKKVLKYIIAVILLASVGIGSMTLASVGVVRLSVFNIIKLGTMGKEGDGGIFPEIMDMLMSHIKDYAYILLVLLGVIVLLAILTAALPAKAAYIVSIAGQIGINIFAGILYIQMRQRIESVESIFEGARSLLEIGGLADIGRIEIHYFPVILWAVLYFTAFVLSVIGLAVREKAPVRERAGDIMPESFQTGGNAYLEKIQELEENRKRQGNPQVPLPGRAVPPQAGGPAPPCEPSMGRAASLRASSAGKNIASLEASAGRDTAPQPAAAGLADQEFGGALLGESGIYASKVYPMKERVPVYIGRDSQKKLVVTRQENMQEAVAEVYYVAEYREYCVKPGRKLAVFLESGQPLGAGREYYLPRGMKICMAGKEEVFTLA